MAIPSAAKHATKKLTNFLKLDYLKTGNPRQRLAWSDLEALQLWSILAPYQPVLAGTIPIEIDIEGVSDLDVICYASNLEEFSKHLSCSFSDQKDFGLHHGSIDKEPYVLCHFQGPNFPIEIFGQNRPATLQDAYRHMLIEHRLLQEQPSDDFRQKIVALKQSGVKTEPAFAQVLGLEGDPYVALLKLED